MIPRSSSSRPMLADEVPGAISTNVSRCGPAGANRNQAPAPSASSRRRSSRKRRKVDQVPSRVNRSTPSIVVPALGLTGYHQIVSTVPLSGQSQQWLGLDIGTRRIGVALSNVLGVAHPLLTIERTQPRRDQRSILRLARRHGCAGIIVGNPLHLSGDPSRQTDRVHRFVDELKALIAESSTPPAGSDVLPAEHPALAVHLSDERLSTAEVHAAL